RRAPADRAGGRRAQRRAQSHRAREVDQVAPRRPAYRARARARRAARRHALLPALHRDRRELSPDRRGPRGAGDRARATVRDDPAGARGGRGGAPGGAAPRRVPLDRRARVEDPGDQSARVCRAAAAGVGARRRAGAGALPAGGADDLSPGREPGAAGNAAPRDVAPRQRPAGAGPRARGLDASRPPGGRAGPYPDRAPRDHARRAPGAVGGGGCLSARAGRHQPAGQRDQVQPRGRAHRGGAVAAGARLGAALGARRGPRHPRRPAGARLRALLPGARHQPSFGPGPRALPEPSDRGAPRRAYLGRVCRRQRQPLRGGGAGVCDAGEAGMSGARRLLVVEDDDSIRQMMEMVLESEGYQVTTATNGAMALAALSRERPALILLDMKMPGVDGWEFARRYAELPAPKPPVIVITAAQDASRRAAEIGAQGYLAKPFSIDLLLQVVEAHLARA